MIEYKIVDGWEKDKVVDEINALLKARWKLHGNLCYHVNDSGVSRFAQSLYRDIEYPGTR